VASHQRNLNLPQNHPGEAEQIIAAIRRGEVDALVVGTPPNEKIYALQSADQPYRIFVDKMAGGAITFTADGIVLYANKRFSEIVGTPLEQIVGSSIADFLAQDDRGVLAELRDAAQAEKSRREVRLLPRDGHAERICHAAFAILPSDVDDFFCAVFTDITALKEAEEALQRTQSELELRVAERTRELAATVASLRESEWERTEALQRAEDARAEAEASNSAKDRFLATLSHELRTPLNAIFGWTQLMRKSVYDHPANEILNEGLSVIERSTRIQVQLIEDLLDVSRIISGKMQIESAPVYLTTVIDAAIESLRPLAEAERVSIERKIDYAGGAVMGDASRLQQVIWNLLSNAIKFTPAGGKVLLRSTRAGSMIEITVSDTGKGIAPEFLNRLFERFAQADSSSTRPHRGLGLGLAIVRHLVELHGGTVQASSEGEGKGATFTVRLPAIDTLMLLASADSGESGGVETIQTQADTDVLAGIHVLIIDDDHESREVLAAMLTRCKARVTQKKTAKSAFESLKATKPDVMLCDIEMPGEDGLSFVKRLRSMDPDGIGQIPAVALTASASFEERARAFRAGFQVHISKPFEYEDLIAVITKLVRR
jgi:PAS domain S-box-containing protein